MPDRSHPPLDAARSACADAVALARLSRDGRAIAICCWTAVLDRSPVPTFAAAAGRRRTLFWQDDEWLLGVGEAVNVGADGPGRGSHLAQEAARIDGRCVIVHAGAGPHPRLPCLLSALSFEDHALGPSHWGRALSGARLWLPRRAWRRRADGSGWIMAALAVSAADQPDALAQRLLADPALAEPAMPAPWPTLPADYADRVEDAVGLLRDGAMRKVVLARAVDVPLARDCDHGAVLDRLHAASHGETTVYAHDLDDRAVFLGATPELLFSAEGGRISTMALAGTCPIGGADDEPRRVAALLDSTKERKEHGLVVEHLVGVLRPRCHPFTLPAAPHPRRLAGLVHLETMIDAELRYPDYLELLTALHPTPAVCGLPTVTAANYIARHERLHRGLYTGAMGWITPHACRFVVPLRGGILRSDADGAQARLFAGAGIVETSDPAAEWVETELKLEPMRGALGMG